MKTLPLLALLLAAPAGAEIIHASYQGGVEAGYMLYTIEGDFIHVGTLPFTIPETGRIDFSFNDETNRLLSASFTFGEFTGTSVPPNDFPLFDFSPSSILATGSWETSIGPAQGILATSLRSRIGGVGGISPDWLSWDVQYLFTPTRFEVIPEPGTLLLLFPLLLLCLKLSNGSTSPSPTSNGESSSSSSS